MPVADRPDTAGPGLETLEAVAQAAGLGAVWRDFPDELRDAHALARTYVAMLPQDIGPEVAPWIFACAGEQP